MGAVVELSKGGLGILEWLVVGVVAGEAGDDVEELVPVFGFGEGLEGGERQDATAQLVERGLRAKFSRLFMPLENKPTRLSISSSRPTNASTSSTRSVFLS